MLSPRIVAGVVHGGLTTLPGSLLVLLVVAPGPVRTVGRAVRATGIGRFGLVLGGLPTVVVALVAAGPYRNAVLRFDRRGPP